MTTSQLALFDYQQLDSETRIVVQQRTGEIKALMKRTAQDIIDIGQKLIEVRDRLADNKRGGFEGWLRAEFNWSKPTAYRFINVAQKFQSYQFDTINIAPSALYLLASADEAPRQEIITRAQSGEAITYTEARQTVNDYKNPRDTKPLYEAHLDAVLDDESKPVCQECGQVYDGPRCPDCTPSAIPLVYQNRQSHTPEPVGRDYCQTPPYAIRPLLSFLPLDKIIWEPAAGEGLLVDALKNAGCIVEASCLLSGQDFFEYEPDRWDIIVTNPPWSKAEDWVRRCFELGKPFALLLKTEISANSGIQRLNAQYGDFEFIYPESRINYKMPNKGWEAEGAPFNSQWYTFGLDIGRPFTYLASINEEKRDFERAIKTGQGS